MSDASPKLDDDALDLLAAFRAEEQLPPDLHDRVWQRLEADVAGPAATGSGGPRWVRWGTGLGVLAAAAAATVLWLGGGAMSPSDASPSTHQAGYERASDDPGGIAESRGDEPRGEVTPKGNGNGPVGAPPAPEAEALAEPEPEPEPSPIDATSTDAIESTTPSIEPPPAKAKPRRGSTNKRAPADEPSSPEPTVSSTLAEENRLLAAARKALIDERPEQALSRLAEHGRRFPSGVLAEERQALRAVALCEAGRTDAGTSAARSFLRAHPHAALAGRVRKACLQQ